MQILIGLIVGTVVGIGIHFVVPDRHTRGVALAPIVGAVVAGLAWTVLTWAGFALDNPWLWLSSLIVPALITWPLLVVLTRLRLAHDERERERLKIG